MASVVAFTELTLKSLFSSKIMRVSKLPKVMIDTNDKATSTFFKDYKETLKARFRQIDIWITAHQLEII